MKWLWIGFTLSGLALASLACNSGGSDGGSTTSAPSTTSGSGSSSSGGGGGTATPAAITGGGALETPSMERRPFSASADCKACHPRQYNEWRTSPHAYSGISPSFYSLVAAGQNSFGAGALINQSAGVSLGGGVGNFCLPCHAPLAFIGDGRYGGNNAGFANIDPDGVIPFICSPTASTPGNAFKECTQENSATVCGNPGACNQFEGRTCSNAPAVKAGQTFPRKLIHCSDDTDCAGGANGCPAGQDCGPCVINPATIFYPPRAQEGINCEVCHTALPNHQRSCQLFRNSDAAGVLSFDIAERGANDGGRRIRLGPYPLDPSTDPNDDGLASDQLPLVLNAFHESARVDSPLGVPYQDTDYAFGVPNPANTNPNIVRPTALSCEDLPYCGNAGAAGAGSNPGDRICNGGPNLLAGGMSCSSDFQCGGCGLNMMTSQVECGPGSPRVGQPCNTSIDCNAPSDPTMNLLQVSTAPGDQTLGPLATRPISGGVPGDEMDRSDANYFRSSMMCSGCHDVRPPFGNAILRSCQLQDTHVCATNADCMGLNIGCPGNDCGPCVEENSAPPTLTDGTSPANGGATQFDPRNNGYRRVENLFSEWQISAYAHPELQFCQGDSFRACTSDAQCIINGQDEGPCSVVSPVGLNGDVITCQDCHMSNFPVTPLVDYTVAAPADPFDNPGVADATTLSPVVRTNKNDLYPAAQAAVEGSQTDPSEAIPVRRVSTHFMAGVDLPLVKFPGQSVQIERRQQLIDSGFKIVIDPPTNQTNPGMPFVPGDVIRVNVEITNVGVGHRYPAGFSHERQNWVQMFVTERDALENGTPGDASDDLDPFDPAAPCMLQNTIARSAEDPRDPVGAGRLRNAGCAFRSGFVLDKAHPETGEMVPDGSLKDEDPEDFFVVAGTRVRGMPGDPRIEVNPGASGRALTITNVCEEATAESYRSAIAAGSGIDVRENSTFPYRVRTCDPNLSPPIPGEEASATGMNLGSGFTAPGFGNPACMEGGADLGPCVPEMELSDGNERGRCAKDLTLPLCQSDAECGDAGPCLHRCSGFPELECCDNTPGSDCEAYYNQIGAQECFIATEGGEGTCVAGVNAGQPCSADGQCTGSTCGNVAICIGGGRSGLGCDSVADCPGAGATCGDVGPCNVENTGIVNFQNQFRQTSNGVCVDRNNPRDASGHPIPILDAGTGEPVSCFLDLTCTLNGLGSNPVCLINGQCAEDAADIPSQAGNPCTNYTYESDCGHNAAGDTIACNVELNLELNGKPSESVFIQNHPFNFNSLPPLQPRVFEYEFEVPPDFADKDLVIAARIQNRHFPMRFLRNLIGTQVVEPPLVVEAQGDPSNPNECNNTRQIDIDCFVDPVTTFGNAEPGGFVPDQQFLRTRTFTVESPPAP
jgi:hypothetical protein